MYGVCLVLSCLSVFCLFKDVGVCLTVEGFVVFTDVSSVLYLKAIALAVFARKFSICFKESV